MPLAQMAKAVRCPGKRYAPGLTARRSWRLPFSRPPVVVYSALAARQRQRLMFATHTERPARRFLQHMQKKKKKAICPMSRYAMFYSRASGDVPAARSGCRVYTMASSPTPCYAYLCSARRPRNARSRRHGAAFLFAAAGATICAVCRCGAERSAPRHKIAQSAAMMPPSATAHAASDLDGPRCFARPFFRRARVIRHHLLPPNRSRHRSRPDHDAPVAPDPPATDITAKMSPVGHTSRLFA